MLLRHAFTLYYALRGFSIVFSCATWASFFFFFFFPVALSMLLIFSACILSFYCCFVRASTLYVCIYSFYGPFFQEHYLLLKRPSFTTLLLRFLCFSTFFGCTFRFTSTHCQDSLYRFIRGGFYFQKQGATQKGRHKETERYFSTAWVTNRCYTAQNRDSPPLPFTVLPVQRSGNTENKSHASVLHDHLVVCSFYKLTPSLLSVRHSQWFLRAIPRKEKTLRFFLQPWRGKHETLNNDP